MDINKTTANFIQCPDLTDSLERFFNTSISHFILFWNRVWCRCHNLANFVPHTSVFIVKHSILCRVNTTESCFY